MDHGWTPEYRQLSFDHARVSKITREFAHETDSFSGILLAEGDQARLYLIIHDLMIANGVSMIRLQDITDEVPHLKGDFELSVIKAKLGDKTSIAPRLPKVSFIALCQWLKAAGVTAAFFEEVDHDSCQVGRIANITSDFVTLDTVSLSGEPDGEWQIKFDDLTRVDCLGEYERSFDLIGRTH